MSDRPTELEFAQMLAANPALKISRENAAIRISEGSLRTRQPVQGNAALAVEKTATEALNANAPISFTIAGPCQPKPRQTRSDKWKKRPCVTKYREWADLARACAQRACGRFLLPNAGIVMAVYIAMPRSWSGRQREGMKGQPHRVKPDGDNLLKAAVDSLHPDSDSMVYEMSVKKFWDDGNGERVEVTLY